MSQILDELRQAKEELSQVIEGLNSVTLARDKIKQDFKLDELKTILKTLPQEIANHQRNQVMLKLEIGQLESKMKSIEIELAYEITMDTNGKEKPKFSNADSRKAELNKRLGEDIEYEETEKKKIQLEGESSYLEIKIDQLRKQFQAVLAIKDLVCAELNLYK